MQAIRVLFLKLRNSESILRVQKKEKQFYGPEIAGMDVVIESNKTAMLRDIQRHVARVINALNATLPLTKEQIAQAIEASVKEFLNDDMA
jgi:hypothetical protein